MGVARSEQVLRKPANRTVAPSNPTYGGPMQ